MLRSGVQCETGLEDEAYFVMVYGGCGSECLEFSTVMFEEVSNDTLNEMKFGVAISISLNIA